ncbi:MAG: hypothetical protein JXA52_01825, partial [Planctomycetes bacterium]|nr:hypothetical protein [Planctomycetota bacterium]
MLFATIRIGRVFCLVALVGLLAATAQANFISLEPDNYAVNSALPDNAGVKLRNASYRPGHAEFDRSWRRIYAKAPTDFPYVGPATGSLVMAEQYASYFNGTDYGLRAWFVDTANNFEPTSYVGFDICWAAASGWSEGAYVTAYGDDINGNEVVIYSKGYRPSGAYTSVDLFLPGIKWLKVICWDNPSTFAQKAFSIDAFKFTDQSGTAFAVPDGENIQAPQGMTLGSTDSLSGRGSVLGNLLNGGTVRPGQSPGILTIDGDYEQTLGGILEIEIDGTDPSLYDQLVITGAASLAGTLEIILDTFLPAVGDSFTIMTFDSYTGGFDDVLIQGGVDDIFFDMAFLEHSLVLTAVPEPCTWALLALGAIGLARR